MTSQPATPVNVRKNLLVSMRDGVELAADLYRPDGEVFFEKAFAENYTM